MFDFRKRFVSSCVLRILIHQPTNTSSTTLTFDQREIVLAYWNRSSFDRDRAKGSSFSLEFIYQTVYCRARGTNILQPFQLFVYKTPIYPNASGSLSQMVLIQTLLTVAFGKLVTVKTLISIALALWWWTHWLLMGKIRPARSLAHCINCSMRTVVSRSNKSHPLMAFQNAIAF